MGYAERKKIYSEIENFTKKPLISYITSSRKNASGMMAMDAIYEFTKQLLEIPKDQKEIDVLIVSNGGDANVAWNIISLLRERFDKIHALLPYAAYSAATLLALGADKIFMHPFANLGPVDPQLAYRKKSPTQPGGEEIIHFGSEDLRNYIDFVRKEVGISDQEQLLRAFELVCADVGSIPIGVAKRSSQLALTMGERLLKTHMKDSNKAKAIAETLNRSFYHHGYPLGAKEAEEIGLPIERPENKLEQLMWKVWEDISEEMQCTKPFNPVEIVLSDPNRAQLLGPVPQIQIPLNLDQKILQQVLNQVLQQIQIINIDPLDYEIFHAAIESTRYTSHFKTKGKINAIRNPDMRISVNIIPIAVYWEPVKEESR